MRRARRPNYRLQAAPPKHAERRAIGVVQRYRLCRLGQRAAKFEPLIIGQQGAGQHHRMRRVLALHHHARRGAHHVVRRLVQDAPARGGDLRHVALRVHLREQHQTHRIEGIDRHVQFAEQPRIAGAQRRLVLAREAAAGDVESEPVACQPDQAVDRRRPASPAALGFMHRRRVVIERDADGQAVADTRRAAPAAAAAACAAAPSHWSAPGRGSHATARRPACR